MIETAELAELRNTLNNVFKFKVGDIVQHRILGDCTDDPTKIVSSWSRDEASGTLFDLRFPVTNRGMIIERWIQECYGGIQKHYHIRMANRDGAFSEKLVSLTEDEITTASTYKMEKGLTEKEILDYVEKRKKKSA